MSNQITVITWRELKDLPGKEGNPFIVNPTKAMLVGLEADKFKTYKIKGVPQDFQVSYDREYAVAWCQRRLNFLAGVSEADRTQFLQEVFTRECQGSKS